MPTVIQCTSCKSQLTVPDALAGQAVKCPRCGVVFWAPATPAYSAAPLAYPIQEQPHSPRSPTWSNPPGHGAPQADGFHGRPPPGGSAPPAELPGKVRAQFAIALLVASMLTDVVSLGTSFLEYNFHRRAERQEPTEEQTDVMETISSCSGLLQSVVLIGAAVAFCMWMFKAHDNLRWFGVSHLQYTPAWAAGAFFVPILNFWYP